MKKRIRSRNKRVLLKNQHKVVRKVKEHQRKLRKEEKKKIGVSGVGRLMKKDPGIPNLWPFKEEMLAQMEKKKAKMEESKRMASELKTAERQRISNLTQLQKQALKRQSKFDKKEGADDEDEDEDEDEDDENGDNEDEDEDEEDMNNAQAYKDAALPTKKTKKITKTSTEKEDGKDDNERGVNKSALDQSRRQHNRELHKIVKQADVIIQVLDARDPLGCRCKQVEEYIMNKDPDKRIILLLNKIDLIPKNVTEMWLKYLRNDLPTVAFKSSTQQQRQNLGQIQSTADNLQSSECVGADALVQLLKNYARNKNLKTSIRVGVIGLPNTGKSSVINSLKRRRVTATGSTPGVTKYVQEIQLDKNIRLLDCPGIVFSKNSSHDHKTGADGVSGSDVDIILRNCVKIEQLKDLLTPIASLLKRCEKEQLMQHYAIASFSNATEFLMLIAVKKGKLKKLGVPDLESAGKAVLQDWVSGKIAFYTLPPTERTHIVDSKVVAQWGKEFSIDTVKQTVLPDRVQEKDGVCIKASNPSAVDADMADLDDYDDEDDEDDDVMDDDDEEENDDDGDEEEKEEEEELKRKLPPKTKIVLQPPKPSKNEKANATKKRRVDEEEEEIERLNPKINHNRKVQMKHQKKVIRKMGGLN